MTLTHEVFTMDGHEIFRMHHRNHEFEIFLRAVTGGVDIHHFTVDDFCAEAAEIIDDTRHGPLVARNRCRREYDGIIFFDPHHLMRSIADTCERGGVFALASCRQDYRFLIVRLAHARGVVHEVFGIFEIAQKFCDFERLHHAASRDVDFAAVLIAMSMICWMRAREEKAAIITACIFNNIIEISCDLALGRCVRVSMHLYYPRKGGDVLFAECRDFVELGGLDLRRGKVKFEVTGVDKCAEEISAQYRRRRESSDLPGKN